MLQALFPDRTANRLILRVTDLLDASPEPSPWALGLLTDFLDGMEEAEFTPAAKDMATYAALVGYAARMIEEADKTAKPLSRELVEHLEQIRAEAPALDEAAWSEALDNPEKDEWERATLKRLREANRELRSDFPYRWEREVLDALMFDDASADWLQSTKFLRLTGYGANVWRIFALKLTSVVNNQVQEEERELHWELVEQLVRLGYVLRCGDRLNGYTDVTFSPRFGGAN